MKKVFLAVLALSLMAVMPSVVFASDRISVTFDGAPIQFADQEPVLIDGRTFVPARAIFEALGYEVEWNESTRQMTVIAQRAVYTGEVRRVRNDVIQVREGEYRQYVFTVGSAMREWFVDDGNAFSTREMPAEMQILNGRVMIPLRAVEGTFPTV